MNPIDTDGLFNLEELYEQDPTVQHIKSIEEEREDGAIKADKDNPD